MTFDYEKIFSRTRLKMNDLKEIMTLSETDLLEINTERLHSVIGDPRIGFIFSSISMDDEVQSMTFELKNANSISFLDEEYVTELLSLGMVITWLRPQVESFEYTSLMLGGKEEKILVNNYKPVVSRLESLETKLHKMIRDHGYMYNSYVSET